MALLLLACAPTEAAQPARAALIGGEPSERAEVAFLEPSGFADDFGVAVRCTAPGEGGRPLLVPVSPGLYRTAHVADARRAALGEEIALVGPGVVEFDGDREWLLEAGEVAYARVERSGPYVIDIGRALAEAASRGLYVGRGHWHDGADEAGLGGGGADCC